MNWTVVRGSYKDGSVQLTKEVSGGGPVEVLVLFPQSKNGNLHSSLWESVRQMLALEIPDLAAMNHSERQTEFDALSDRVADAMPFHSLDEFERAMRGDEYGLTRY